MFEKNHDLSARIATLLLLTITLWSITLAAWAQQCPGSLNGLQPRLREETDGPFVSGPIVQCVEPNTDYRLETLGPAGNTDYCFDALTNFTFPNSITPTRTCQDATNGDLLLPFVPAVITGSTVPFGFTVAIEPNANSCANNPVTSFSLPACDAITECIDLPNNAVAWWKFDETSGVRAFDSIGDNDGTLISGPSRINGIVENALDFDGINDVVTVPDDSALDFGAGDFSIEAWVRTNDTNGVIVSKRRLISGNNNFGGNFAGYIFMVFNGNLLVQLANASGSPTFTNYISNTPINDNEWHHVAVTIDRNNATGGRIYVDGFNVYTFDPTDRTGNLNNSGVLQIGQVPNAPTNPNTNGRLDGQIDEVTLYDRVLSSAEINNIFAANSFGKCPTISPVQAIVDCLVELSFFDNNANASCFASALGGSGSNQYSWSFFGDGTITPTGNQANVLNCSGQGTVSVTINDGFSTSTDSVNIDCDSFGFGF